MSVYDEKPWLSLYDPEQPAEISLEFTDALSMFRASAARNPDGGYQLFRIGDAVAGRNVHAAMLDAARLCRAI